MREELSCYDLAGMEKASADAAPGAADDNRHGRDRLAGAERDRAMKKLGLDIEPHRRRMNESQPGLDEKFKDVDDPLRLVFVCAMWLTGFDAPSCSTIYLDKPMRNHTLMQTIARATVFSPANTAA
ncbi:MAG: hypothetical protein R3F33_14530 [Planctomycetota bacterium]